MRPISTMPIVCLLAYLTTAATLEAGNSSTTGPERSSTADERPGESASDFDPLLLNIRMSPNPLQPPPELVKQSWILDGYRLGRLDATSPRAAVIDDDQHRRLLILSATDQGNVRLDRVADLPIDVGLRLSAIMKHAKSRDCPHQRTDPAGELGCLALSLLEALQE